MCILPTTLFVPKVPVGWSQPKLPLGTGLAWLVLRPRPENENIWASGPVLAQTGSMLWASPLALLLLQDSDLGVLITQEAVPGIWLITWKLG